MASRRCFGVFAGDRDGLARLGEDVGQPEPEGLLRATFRAGVDEAAGLAKADGADEPLHVGEAGEVDFRPAEEGVAGDDAEVAGQREFAAAADRVAVDRGDDREAGLLELAVDPIDPAIAADGVGRVGLLELVDVEATGEHPLAAGEDDDPHFGGLQGFDCGEQLAAEGAADRVDRRMLQLQRADVAVDARLDELPRLHCSFITHRGLLHRSSPIGISYIGTSPAQTRGLRPGSTWG